MAYTVVLDISKIDAQLYSKLIKCAQVFVSDLLRRYQENDWPMIGNPKTGIEKLMMPGAAEHHTLEEALQTGQQITITVKPRRAGQGINCTVTFEPSDSVKRVYNFDFRITESQEVFWLGYGIDVGGKAK